MSPAFRRLYAYEFAAECSSEEFRRSAYVFDAGLRDKNYGGLCPVLTTRVIPRISSYSKNK